MIKPHFKALYVSAALACAGAFGSLPVAAQDAPSGQLEAGKKADRDNWM